MKITLVHDYLTQKKTAERVFKEMFCEVFCQQFPATDSYTSVCDVKHRTKLRQRLFCAKLFRYVPGAKHVFCLFAPPCLIASQRLDLSRCDLVTSHSSSFFKSANRRVNALRILTSKTAIAWTLVVC